MDETRAVHQDILPLKIMILNLMPLKEDTELQLLRSLSNTSLQVDVFFASWLATIRKVTSTCREVLERERRWNLKKLTTGMN